MDRLKIPVTYLQSGLPDTNEVVINTFYGGPPSPTAPLLPLQLRHRLGSGNGETRLGRKYTQILIPETLLLK